MKKILCRFSGVFLAAIFLAQSGAYAKTSVAVYPIKAAGADTSVASALTSLLGYELGQSPNLIVIKEDQLQEVMKRQAMNQSDMCDSTVCQVEIGKLVQAQKMVSGEIIKMGFRYIMTINLINIQSGAVELNTKVECACDEDQLDKLVFAAAAKVRNHFGESVPLPVLPQSKSPPPSTTPPYTAMQPAPYYPPPAGGEAAEEPVYHKRGFQLGTGLGYIIPVITGPGAEYLEPEAGPYWNVFDLGYGISNKNYLGIYWGAGGGSGTISGFSDSSYDWALGYMGLMWKIDFTPKKASSFYLEAGLHSSDLVFSTDSSTYYSDAAPGVLFGLGWDFFVGKKQNGIISIDLSSRTAAYFSDIEVSGGAMVLAVKATRAWLR